MRAFVLAIWLTVAACGAAVADAAGDCKRSFDSMDAVSRASRACTLIIDGKAKGDKAFAYFRRGFA